MAVITDYHGLNNADATAVVNLLDWGDRTVLWAAPYMKWKLVDDMFKAARANPNHKLNQWLTERGYTLAPADLPTASQTAITASGHKEGDLIQVTNPRGGIVNRYFHIDDNGDQWALATKDDLATADYLYSNDKWINVTTDANNQIIATVDTDLANKSYDILTGTWKDIASTDPFADMLGGNAPTTPIEDAQIASYQASIDDDRAQLQYQYDQLNSGNLSDAQQMALSQWYNNAMVSIQQDQMKLDQYKTQMTAWQNAGAQQLENQKYMSELAQSPLDSVAYAYRQYGANVPSYWKSSFQPLADPYAGLTNPTAPTWGNIPLSPDLSQIQGTNYAPQATPPPSGGITPAYSGVNYGNRNWYESGNGTYSTPPVTVGNTTQSTKSWGPPSTVQDTLAVLRAANPSVNYYIGPDGMIKVG